MFFKTGSESPEAIESAYIAIFSAIAAGKFHESETSRTAAHELEADGLIIRRSANIGVPVTLGWRLTYIGRLEWARLLRERRERGLLYRICKKGTMFLCFIIPPAWMVFTLIIDLFRDEFREFLRAAF